MSKKHKNQGENIKSALNEVGDAVLGKTKKSLNNSLNNTINQAGDVILNAGVNAIKSGNLKSAGTDIKNYAKNAARGAANAAAGVAVNTAIDTTFNKYGHKITKFLGVDFKMGVPKDPIGLDMNGVTGMPAVIEYGIIVICSILFIIFSSIFWLKIVVAVVLACTIVAIIRMFMVIKTEQRLYNEAISAYDAHEHEFSNHDICYRLDKGQSLGSSIDRAYVKIREYNYFRSEKVESDIAKLVTTILFSLFWLSVLIWIIAGIYNKIRQWLG